MLWNTKKEIPIGSGSLRRKSIGVAPVKPADVGSRKRNLYLKNANSARLKAMPIGSHTLRLRKASVKNR